MGLPKELIRSYVCSYSAWVSLGVFLLISLSLVVPSGYSLGALMLFITGIVSAFSLKVIQCTQSQRKIIWALVLYVIVGLAAAAVHKLGHRALELPVRAGLAIFVFLLVLRQPPIEKAILVGLICGAIGATGIALWQWHSTGGGRAEGFGNAIQFGNIALLWACLLMAAFRRAKLLGQYGAVFIAVGILAGLLASILSGARGGWIALPMIGLLHFALAGSRLSLPQFAKLMASISLAVLVVYQFSIGGLIKERLNQIWVDVQRYEAENAEETSVGSRWRMWQISVEAIGERPFMGWGNLTQLRESSTDRKAEGVLIHFNHVHNDFLDAWVKRGAIGALAYLGLVLLPIVIFMHNCRLLIKKQLINSAAFSSSLMGLTLSAAVLVFGLTQAFLTHASGLTLYVFLLAVFAAQISDSNTLSPSRDLNLKGEI